MLKLRWILLPGILAVSSAGADSDGGAAIFESQGCIQCHSLNGRGGKSGPDLGRRIGRGYTPAALASAMWNHALKMWEAMVNTGVKVKPLGPDAAADLVAFFTSARFFDKPADAARGRRAFESHRCSKCHSIDQSRAGGAPPVSSWNSLRDTLEFAEAMWNHTSRMQQEFAARGMPWSLLSGQDLGDMLVYLRHLPSTRTSVSVQTPSTEPGKALFASRGCAKCHTGDLDLTGRLQGRTLTDIAATLWNHAPQMANANLQFAPGELRAVVSYLWTESLNQDSGDPKRGSHVFNAKRCSACHTGEASGAPSLDRLRSNTYSPVTMISVVWSHGPAMLQQMRSKHIPWPRFDRNEMSDLISFLNFGARRSDR